MYRFIEKELKKWSLEAKPHPLMLRGARQVGKSYLVENFAKKNFNEFININFDLEPETKKIFEDLSPHKILEKIQAKLGVKITIGKTLIFLDEIQECHQAIKSLRYFYEKIPGLHIISAGSLLDFALESGEFSMPVGRMHFLFMHPMSFHEYIYQRDKGDSLLLKQIKELSLTSAIDDFTHQILLDEVKRYNILGGMPEVIEKYFTKTSDLNLVEAYSKIQSSILLNYREDFHKYSTEAKYKYLERVFKSVPKLVGKKFKYSNIDRDGDLKKDESKALKEATLLLSKANIINYVKCTSMAGLPFDAEASDRNFKAIFLDTGLMIKALGSNTDILEEVLNAKDFHSIASGAIAEQFVGQELLAALPCYEEPKLYYWAREDSNSSAEVDYLINIGTRIFPIEVKAGKTGRLTSLNMAVEKYKLPFGIRISQKKLELENRVLSVPFYAIPEIPRLVKSLL